MPASVSFTTWTSMSGSWSCGRFDRSPLGSVLAETWKGSSLIALVDVALDILGEARIDLVEDVLAVPQRPHLADGLVADAGDDAADVVHDGVDGAALVVPVLLA